MVYDWVQGWTLYSLILKNIDIEANFDTEKFPKFEVTANSYAKEHDSKFAAIYYHKPHKVFFSEEGLYLDNMWFSHTYFHELIHSTTHFNNRFQYMWFETRNKKDIIGLEERIADIGALVLCLNFQSDKVCVKTILEQAVSQNDTNLAIPWKDLEDAVLFYVKNKTCSKLKQQLQLVKQIIMDNDLCPIYEGNFNGQ